MSFVLGNFKLGVAGWIHSMDEILEFNESSESGGLEFLGTIPGFLADVMKRKTKSCKSYYI